ncbi:MAG: DegT/DnrJ/EryC1/StrS family aminotransferase [Nitrososphaerota archaeon]|nr:DegT/DnrJ/EryC1/StrS family aminotransferase [Nitrososphaerota archaeon]MDG6972257.1 DegT/DnrJ/EryC1/StrS family aminotransferase [Nitrososphaerota archaeon]MDG6977367.1 DegT/DnrJ/EryC1/StrS family aminotransferase [Nitrososphaerota archaeon]MDG6979503.1 DegT/DnrJ/EryC1/StrS family aminotransferase [Nitrososphaerota archaeon]MDG6983752.1 DegT/DnrJ/EryC1/StrS family aminotransferase [Nitrososphaerota archaeon]
MSHIPQGGYKIPVCRPKLGESEYRVVNQCLKDGWVSGISPYVERFEADFAKFCGAKYGVACNSGTTALQLALATLGIGEGDEVIIPTFTMIATPNAVTYTGAKPVLVDAEDRTWNIDVDKIRAAVTSKTKAIMPVHTYGHPADMGPITELAEERGIFVVEDAAESHGAEYRGRRTGGLSDIGCFSFYANKIITTGEGGMLVTNSEEYAEKAKWLRAHAFGREGKHFYHEALGFGYRLSGLQAALGLGQMEHIDEFVAVRRRNASLYNSFLKELGGKVSLPPEAPWAKNIYWMYSILVEDSFGISRQGLMDRLERDGVETRTFFYPVHAQPIYANLGIPGAYPVADAISRKGMNLPSGNDLTEDEVEFVCERIKACAKGSQ